MMALPARRPAWRNTGRTGAVRRTTASASRRACPTPGARPARSSAMSPSRRFDGGPSDSPSAPDGAARVIATQRGGQRPAGSNFEGRPLVPTVCANIETKGISWKLPLPAYSGSTPIIWGETIFLNVATGTNTGDLELWAIDRNKQSVTWKRPLAAGNNMQRKQNMSTPSPITDGKYVWVMTGVGILKAFDFGGKEIWTRDIQADYGRFGLNWGYANTPLLKGDALYVPVLHGMKTDDPSYLLKIDKMSGKTIWRVERPNPAVQRIAGCLHHAGVDRSERPRRIDHHRRRRRLRPRSCHRQGILARRRAQSATQRRLSHRRVADHRQQPDHRADARQPDGGDEAGRQRRRGEDARRLDVRAGARCADAGQRRQAAVCRARQRHRARARRQHRGDRLWSGAPAVGHLQRLADPGGRQDLRDDRRRGIDDGVSRRSEVRDHLVEPAAERLRAVLPEHGRDFRGAAVHAHVVVPVGDRRPAENSKAGLETRRPDGLLRSSTRSACRRP